MDNVIPLKKYLPGPAPVEQALENTLADLRSGAIRADKVLLVLVDETEGSGFGVAVRGGGGPSGVEALAALDISASLVREMMGF